MRADLVPGVEVHPVSGSPGGTDAGIEVEPVATKALSFGLHPIQKLRREAAATPGSECREVTDVNVMAPGQAVTHPESCHRQRVWLIVVERADDSIAARA